LPAHCADSFFSRSANHLSRIFAVEGIRLLLPIFRMMAEKGCDNLDYDTREKLYCASIYGGLAISMGYLLTKALAFPTVRPVPYSRGIFRIQQRGCSPACCGVSG